MVCGLRFIKGVANVISNVKDFGCVIFLPFLHLPSLEAQGASAPFLKPSSLYSAQQLPSICLLFSLRGAVGHGEQGATLPLGLQDLFILGMCVLSTVVAPRACSVVAKSIIGISGLRASLLRAVCNGVCGLCLTLVKFCLWMPWLNCYRKYPYLCMLLHIPTEMEVGLLQLDC